MALWVERATVAAVDEVAPRLAVVHLDLALLAPHLQPGQLLMVRCAEPDLPAADPLLPRAFFAFAVDARAGRASVLVAERGRGSAWLCRRKPGDQVLVFGPAGRALAAGRLTRHLLLLAEGVLGVAALAQVAGDAARRGLAVTLVENAGRGDDHPGGPDSCGVEPGSEVIGVPANLLNPDVEYRATSPEAGGLAGMLPQALPWADEVIIAAPAALLETLAALRRDGLPPFTLYGGLPIQAIPLPVLGDDKLEAAARGGDALPCGTGVCGVCVVVTRAGPKLFCRAGPAFALEDLRFDPPDDDA